MLIQEVSDYGEQMAPVILEEMSTNLIDFDQKVLWSGEAFRETINETWFWWLKRSMPSGISVMCSRQKFCPFSERHPTFFPCNKITRPHMWHRLHYPTWETKISCFCRGLPSVQTSTPLNISGHGWKSGCNRKIHKIWWIWYCDFRSLEDPTRKLSKKVDWVDAQANWSLHKGQRRPYAILINCYLFSLFFTCFILEYLFGTLFLPVSVLFTLFWNQR